MCLNSKLFTTLKLFCSSRLFNCSFQLSLDSVVCRTDSATPVWRSGTPSTKPGVNQHAAANIQARTSTAMNASSSKKNTD